jgi:hypothetical protein
MVLSPLKGVADDQAEGGVDVLKVRTYRPERVSGARGKAFPLLLGFGTASNIKNRALTKIKKDGKLIRKFGNMKGKRGR